MRKKLIVHVGLGKAGSSSIQMAIKEIRENSIKGLFCPTSPTGSLISEYMVESVRPKCDTQKINEIDEKLETKDLTCVISGEILAHTDNWTKSKLIELWCRHFEEVLIVVYVRNPLIWNSATASQLILRGFSLETLEKSPYLATQSGLLDIFQTSQLLNKNIKMSVSKFEDAVKHDGGIAGHFYNVISRYTSIEIPLDSKNKMHLNRSLRISDYIAKGLLNGVKMHHSSNLNNSEIDTLETALEKFNVNERFCQFYAYESAVLASKYDALMLREKYKIDYKIEPVDKSSIADFQELSATMKSELLKTIDNF